MGVFLCFSFLLLLEFPRLRRLHPVENKSVKKKYLTFPWTIFSQWAHNLLFFCMSLICSIVLLWSFFDIIFWHPLELCILFFKDFFPGKTCFQWSDLSFCPLEMMSLILTGFTKRCCRSYVNFYKIINHNGQGDSCSDLDPRSSPVSVEVVLADNSHRVLWQHLLHLNNSDTRHFPVAFVFIDDQKFISISISSLETYCIWTWKEKRMGEWGVSERVCEWESEIWIFAS